MKYFNGVIIFIIIIIKSLTAQPVGKISAGTETDILPFATGGYYFLVWAGSEYIRLRAVITGIYPPEFVLPDGMTNLKTDAAAVIADYFPFRDSENQFSGMWLRIWAEY